MGSRKILNILVFGLIGLAIGYAAFGKIAGDYVSLKTVFSFGGNALQGAFRSLSGLEDMRNKILICGAIGALIGFLFPARK